MPINRCLQDLDHSVLRHFVPSSFMVYNWLAFNYSLHYIIIFNITLPWYIFHLAPYICTLVSQKTHDGQAEVIASYNEYYNSNTNIKT